MPNRSGVHRLPVSQANRGMGLEHMVEHTCRIYRKHGWGCVQKIATPAFQGSRRHGNENEWKRKKSTIDFLGVFAGWPFAFDTKETRSGRFDLAALKPHQRVFLEDFVSSGGRGFVLIEFVPEKRIFAATIEWLDAAASELGRKSVPFSYFETCTGCHIGVREIPMMWAGIPVPFGLVVEGESKGALD